MENVGRLQEKFDVLSAEMSVLKHLRDDVAKRGERGMNRWLQNVKAVEREVEERLKELNAIRKGHSPNIKVARLKLHEKVIKNLKAVADLKREGNRNVVAHKVGVVAELQGTDLVGNEDGSSSETVERFISQMAKEKPLRFSTSQLRSFTSDFSSHLGSGGYGEVYKGRFPNGVRVAVKVLKAHVKDSVKKQFMAEVSTMGRTYHRNLVRLYGFCFDTDSKALVYEYMENGSLDKILYNNHLNLEWEKLYDIAIETAKGLSYLHENCHKQIIHCDIKAGNVLIDTDFCPKVADFGLAKLCNRDLSHVTFTGPRGTPGYAAPEVWLPLPVTYKCDVYSFGMMSFEILGRKKNMNGKPGESQVWFPKLVWEKFQKGQLEEIIRDCGIEEQNKEKAIRLSIVALWCAQYVPQDRPSMSTVVKILEGEIQAMDPPNPFPQLVSSGVASRVIGLSTGTLVSSVSTKYIVRKTPVPVPLSFSSVSSESEVSSIFPERKVELQSPIQRSMVEVKKNEDTKDIRLGEKKEEVITVVLMVYMHCEACAMEVKKYLKRLEGVYTVALHLNTSQVTVKGVINPVRLVDYIYKKTNKRAEIVKVETEMKAEEKAIAKTEPKKQDKEKEMEKTKPGKKTVKVVTMMKSELMKAEDGKVIVETDPKKQEERGVAEIKLEKKASKRVMKAKTEPEKTDEEMINAKTESKKKPEEQGVPQIKTGKENREKKVQTKLEKKIEEWKELMRTAETNHDKEKEEKGNGKTKPHKEEEEKVMKQTDAKPKDEEKIKEVDGYVKTGQKEEEQQKVQKGNDEEVEKHKENGEQQKEKHEEAKLMEEEGTEVETEPKKSRLYNDPPKYEYPLGNKVGAERKENEFYQHPPSPNYHCPPPMMFSDENPNAWCSIQ